MKKEQCKHNHQFVTANNNGTNYQGCLKCEIVLWKWKGKKDLPVRPGDREIALDLWKHR